MTEKMTINKQFEGVRSFLVDNGAPAEMIAFIDNRMEQTKRKNANRSNKPTKSATETADVAEKILGVLPNEGKFTATQIQAMDSTLATASNQRITAALKVLVNTGFVKNIHEKGKSLFSRV